VWSKGERTLQIRRGFQVIERFRQRICLASEETGKKERREIARCEESVKVGEKEGKEIRNLKMEEIEDRPRSNLKNR